MAMSRYRMFFASALIALSAVPAAAVDFTEKIAVAVQSGFVAFIDMLLGLISAVADKMPLPRIGLADQMAFDGPLGKMGFEPDQFERTYSHRASARGG